ncbi:multidrug effflux MFS transporter [Azospira restricta]|uniref:Bcr/CflA family efflux transporter n=1 Tax=Azospira restricta TaxID=404405 RepID=A0A974SQ57_9RHOO|nr:multidrug effflux MFS transporter [Azospira restricta]QRJ64421.1 multidrug effflux MFS transporter [Azospira restricta]
MTRRLSDRGFALLLAALSALGPFSIDTYLPSFPEIGEKLGASPLQVQQTLTAYLIPFAAMALWHGAIADALGRRRVILWALALFALASAGCAFATKIEHLWLLRAAQGISAGAGVVIGRAIVRDLYDGAAAQRLMSHVAITFALAPAIAPVIGGWLHSWFGWRAVFVFLTLLTATLWLVSWRWLPETLPADRRRSLHPVYLGRTYWKVLTRPSFLAATAALACNFCGFFIYVLSAPVFLLTHLGVSERAFLWLFGPAMGGLMLGSWLSGRLAGTLTPLQCIGRGYAVMAAAALFNLALSHALPAGVPWSVLPLFVYTTGMALAMSALTLLALDPFAGERGLAASCQTFLQSGTNGLVAGLVAPLLWASTTTLAWGMAGFALLGAGASALYLRSRHD